MNIVVAGTGYVGLVTGVCLAEKGNDVTCVDVNEEKIKMLRDGKSPIYENDLEELMEKNKGKITYTTNSADAYKNADIIFIGVGTPEKKDGSANLSYVYTVAKEIADNIEKNCIIVVKSTVPIGTNEKIEKLIKNHLKNKVKIAVASNPEFLAQGTAVRDTLHASRIVIGAEERETAEALKKLYENFESEILVTDRKSAEMIKYASNDFLALKISYINEIANLCEKIGANIEDVSKGMGLDPRIGNKFLKAGIGYGGSCFPKDTKALNWLSNMNDYEIKTVKAAVEVNENQKLKLIKKANKYYDTLEGLKIAILGLTFKPETDDLRESPAISNIPILLEEGANIKVWDKVGMNNVKKIFQNELQYCETIDEAIEDTDLCLIYTEWGDVKKFDIDKYIKLMKNPIVIDGRNCYSIKDVENMKMIYDSIGRKTIKNL